jgi:hypothetical protein
MSSVIRKTIGMACEWSCESILWPNVDAMFAEFPSRAVAVAAEAISHLSKISFYISPVIGTKTLLEQLTPREPTFLSLESGNALQF